MLQSTDKILSTLTQIWISKVGGFCCHLNIWDKIDWINLAQP